MIRFFFITTFLTLVSINALSLKDKLKNGKVGDYIITEQNGYCSLIRIHTQNPPKLILEEISFPHSVNTKDVAKWIELGAKGHTSWTLLEINLSKDSLESCFSFTKNVWLVPTSDESFLLKILTIPLEIIDNQSRRKIGPPPLDGLDTRKVWNPPLFFNGKKESEAKFTPFKLNYPKDGSKLSGKRVELYFNFNDPTFPFPYWGQITDDSDASLKFKVIDSGKNLSSPKKLTL